MAVYGKISSGVIFNLILFVMILGVDCLFLTIVEKQLTVTDPCFVR